MKAYFREILGWLGFTAAVLALLWVRPERLLGQIGGGWSSIAVVLVLATLAGIDLLRPRPRPVFHVDRLPDDAQAPLDLEFEQAEALLESDQQAGLRDWRRAQAHELQLLRERLDGCRERAGASASEARRYRRELQEALRRSERADRASLRRQGTLDHLYAELGMARRALFAGEIAWVDALLATGALR